MPGIEQITPRLRRIGDLYELDGEPLRRVVGPVRVGRDPFDLLWEMRQFAIEVLGVELEDDTYPDEPIRRIVGRGRPRLPSQGFTAPSSR